MVCRMKNFLVVDNFLPDPHDERALALRATYETIEHNGITYRGMSEQPEGPECAEIRRLLGFTGGKIVTGWRRYLAEEEKETYIHPDSDIGRFTGILYLNPPEQCYGGTAFWRYRQYGWGRVPAPAELEAQGLRDTPALWKRILDDGEDEFLWEMHEYVPMGWNRLLIFDSRYFHSRYPKRSFGTELSNARLIKLFFITPPEGTP
jgi:hypothetical protein